MTRKKNTTSNGFAYGIVITVCIAVISIILYQNAYGITREDIALQESEINELKSRISNYESQIKEQNKIISQKRDIMNDKKENYREIKSKANISWDAITKVDTAKKQMDDAKTAYSQARDNLSSMLTDRSNDIRELRELEKNVSDNFELLETEAIQKNSRLTKLVGIQLSNSCITMIQNNITSSCPTYDDLVKYDSSNTYVSGQFIRDNSTGFLHRENPQYKDSWRWYDDDPEIRLIVDPPQGMDSRIKMITIQPNFDTYIVNGEETIPSEFEYIDVEIEKTLGNQTKVRTVQVLNQTQDFAMVLYHDRYVDRCNKAIINADNWKFLLGDTITYLRSGCSETEFDEREIIQPVKTEIDISTSPSYQYQTWLKNVLDNCIYKYGAC